MIVDNIILFKKLKKITWVWLEKDYQNVKLGVHFAIIVWRDAL